MAPFSVAVVVAAFLRLRAEVPGVARDFLVVGVAGVEAEAVVLLLAAAVAVPLVRASDSFFSL